MTKPIEKTGELTERELDSIVAESSREAHVYKYLSDTDGMLITQLAEKYRDVVPPDRIEAVLSMPTRFESRKSFDESLAAAEGRPASEEHVLGYSRFDREPAHVAMDHLEIPKTIAHERLHQLSDPAAVQELGRPLYEGVTEDLAIHAIGAESVERRDVCYPVEKAVAREMREIAGDEAVERAYFQGDVTELRRRLDEKLGAAGLERLQQQILDLSSDG